MKEQYPKQKQEKEPLPVKFNQVSSRPSVYQRVAFFRRCGKRKRG